MTSLDQLCQLVKADDVEGLQAAVAAGAHTTEKFTDGGTLLHVASEFNAARVIRFLVSTVGFDLNTATNDGSTPLLFAATANAVEAASTLLELGAQVNLSNENGDTPLHFAVSCAPGIAEVLLAHGANVHAGDLDGETPLHWACKLGNESCIQQLIAAGANRNALENNSRSPLHYASKYNRAGAVKLILGNIPSQAILTIVESLDSDARCALHFAAKYNSVQVLEILLPLMPNHINAAMATGETPLHYAARDGSFEASELLLARGADYGNTPLHTAAAQNRMRVIALFLRHGAQVESPGHYGRTPLCKAVLFGALDATRLLVAQSANPLHVDNTNLSIMQHAEKMAADNAGGNAAVSPRILQFLQSILAKHWCPSERLSIRISQPFTHSLLLAIHRAAREQIIPFQLPPQIWSHILTFITHRDLYTSAMPVFGMCLARPRQTRRSASAASGARSATQAVVSTGSATDKTLLDNADVSV